MARIISGRLELTA